MKFRKRAGRFLAVLLTAAAMIAPFSGLPAQAASVGDYHDVSSGDWFYSAVDYVVGRGLFQGTSATMFNPNGRMTRGMFITVLGRYANVSPDKWLTGTVTGSDVNLRSGAGTGYGSLGTLGLNTSVTIQGKSGGWYKVSTASGSGYVSADYVKPDRHWFSDVDYGQYYAGYAVWAYEKGIVNGNGTNDRFTPDSNITREQLCTMLSRFASVMGISISQSQAASSFADSGSISSWAADSVTAMQRGGVIQGDTNGSFRPKGSATRAETAAMFQRFNNACGGFTAPNQDPPPPSVDSGSSGSSGNSGNSGSTGDPGSSGGTSAPPSVDGGDTTDTPATLIGGSVYVPANVIRVGLFVETGKYHTSVSAATLSNVSGSGFEFGTMSGRQFSSSGVTTGETYITITADGTNITVSGAGGTLYTAAASAIAIRPIGSRPVTCVNGEYRYHGDFEFRQASGAPGKVTVINFVNIEDYVKGVLPYEFSVYWPAEVLKAGAIVSRSHIVTGTWGVYDAYGMDIVANDGSQTYRGRAITYDESYFAATDAAVEATRNMFLTYGGSLCVGCYSACNGGTTASAQQVFGVNYPYLVSKADPYEQAALGDIAAAGGNYSAMVSASHHVGLSGWGAYAMDKYYHKDYQTILGFYFQGANLQYGA